MHQDSGKIYETKKLTLADTKRLVGIPNDHEAAVRSMNRSQRRAWAKVFSTTNDARKAFEAAKQRGWRDAHFRGA
jgi:hypothetical protein